MGGSKPKVLGPFLADVSVFRYMEQVEPDLVTEDR